MTHSSPIIRRMINLAGIAWACTLVLHVYFVMFLPVLFIVHMLRVLSLRHDRRRLMLNLLIGSAILGGFLGSLFAWVWIERLLRHLSQDRSFTQLLLLSTFAVVIFESRLAIAAADARDIVD